MGEKVIEKLDFDPYETLELSEECCSLDDVKKAYRKKALQWHPDKNPDRREYAQKMFLQIARASEILLDSSAKAALDRVRKAKRDYKQRTLKLDVKRRKMKEDLEAREQRSQSEKEEDVKASEKLAQEVERLRRQGSELLKSMREEIERQIREEKLASASCSQESSEKYNKLKVRWPLDSASFDSDSLTRRFSVYGSVMAVVVGNEKKKAKTSTALIEFKTFKEAELALISENSIHDNILTVSWLVHPPAPAGPDLVNPSSDTNVPSPIIDTSARTMNERDFESVVLTRMRQAEERKRLIDQMKQEDERELRRIFKDDTVNVEEVMELFAAYKTNRADWIQYAKFDPHRYTRNLVDEGNGKYNLMILCWGEGMGSSIHDHANAHCFVKILEGKLKETLYEWPEEEGDPMTVKNVNVYDTDGVAYMSDELGLHRMENPSHADYTVTLHLYIPAFDSCYMFDERTGHRSKCKVTFWSKYGEKVQRKLTQNATANAAGTSSLMIRDSTAKDNK